VLVRLIVAALATWRISSLMLYETGPFEVFTALRTLAARREPTAELFSCIYCLSVWVGLLCAVLAFTEAWIGLIPLALSAGAIGVQACLGQQSR